MPINGFLYPGASGPAIPYDVANSCRFEDGDTSYLQKTFSSGNRKTFTISAWVKRSDLGRQQIIINTQDDGSNQAGLQFLAGDTLNFYSAISSTYYQLITNRVFRDPSAWYHIVAHYDTTNSTSGDRIKLYINGVRETSFSTETQPSQDYDTFWNQNTKKLSIGTYGDGAGLSYSGYMTEVVMVDGTALDPTSFGEFDEDSPTIWKPKNVSGLTFGTNGFYLDFEDSSNLGNDANGGTDFTENNIAATDQSTDTCTNNFATFNGVLGYNSTIALAEGNLKGTTGSTHEALYGSIFSSIGVTQGKWYAEFKVTTNSDKSIIGISADMESDADGSDGSAFNFIYLGQGIGYYGNNGKIFHTDSNTQMTYGSAVSNNNIVGVALDVDNQEVYFSINGTFQNSGDPTSGSSKTGGVVNEGARNIFSTGTGTIFFAVADFDRDATCAIEANFGGGSVSAISSGNSDANGHGNFEYSVPSGYFALCTKNLAEFG